MTNLPVQPLSAKQAERVYFGLTAVELMMLGQQIAAIRDGHHVCVDTATHTAVSIERLKELENYEWMYKQLSK